MGNGYQYVKARIGGKSRSVQLHRLVAAAFLPSFDHGLQVDHLNCIKSDNRVSNLEMVTRAENMVRASSCGRIRNNEGHHFCKFSDDVVRELRSVTGIPQKDLAIKFGMSAAQVSRILGGNLRKRKKGM